jgi:putative membrane protein
MLVALAGVWLLSVWQALLKFTGFTLLTTPRGLATESGLFTRTRAEVVLAKVQRVRSEEPLIRRLLGYGSICIETARSPVPGQDSSGMALLPMLGSHELGWTSQLVFPELSLNPWETPLSRPASRALLRELILGSLKWLMLSIALASWLEQPLLLLLTVLGPIVAILDWRRQGWGLTETHLVARSGFFTRTTAILPRKKLQAISLVQDPLERLARLARIQVRVAGAEQAFPVLDEAVARKLFATLTTAR